MTGIDPTERAQLEAAFARLLPKQRHDGMSDDALVRAVIKAAGHDPAVVDQRPELTFGAGYALQAAQYAGRTDAAEPPAIGRVAEDVRQAYVEEQQNAWRGGTR